MKRGLTHDRVDTNKFNEESPRDELGLHFPELSKGQVPSTIKEENILNKDLNLSDDANLFEEKEKEKDKEKGQLLLPEIGKKAKKDSMQEDGESRIDLSQDTEGRSKSRKNQMNIFDPNNQPDSEAFVRKFLVLKNYKIIGNFACESCHKEKE